MTPEEMERTLQFFIDQQAQFAADLQQSRELQIGHQEILSNLQNQLSRLTDATLTIVGMLGKLADIQEKTEACLIGTDAKVSQLTESHTRTDAKMMETDDRLNAFIDVVERYISDRGDKGDG